MVKLSKRDYYRTLNAKHEGLIGMIGARRGVSAYMPSLDGHLPRTLVFGASGQIGSACVDSLTAAGHATECVARHASAGTNIAAFDPFEAGSDLPPGLFDAVVWAQGANFSDSVLDFDRNAHLDLYRANALFVAETLARLLSEDRLVANARLCVVSSIWQTVGRRDKLSYMMSKAALQGLVLSASIDLADRGILVNAVLPGALDTPMTRANLSPDQVGRIAAETPFARLPAIEDVAALVTFLCSPANTSITGQFVAVDLGFSHARLV